MKLILQNKPYNLSNVAREFNISIDTVCRELSALGYNIIKKTHTVLSLDMYLLVFFLFGKYSLKHKNIVFGSEYSSSNYKYASSMRGKLLTTGITVSLIDLEKYPKIKKDLFLSIILETKHLQCISDQISNKDLKLVNLILLKDILMQIPKKPTEIEIYLHLAIKGYKLSSNDFEVIYFGFIEQFGKWLQILRFTSFLMLKSIDEDSILSVAKRLKDNGCLTQ